MNHTACTHTIAPSDAPYPPSLARYLGASAPALRVLGDLAIHSHLTYLRDRLLLARELLTESGSVFVQISDENKVWCG